MHETSEFSNRAILTTARPAREAGATLEALRRRDVIAWTTLFEDHRDLVYRATLSQVRDRELAEDITGQVFLEAIEGIRRYRERGRPIAAWLLAIAKFRSLDALRKRQRERNAVLPAPEPASSAPAMALDALGRLTHDQREVIHLRFVEDHSIETVATLTGRTPGAVKSLQHRALQNLRAQLTTANTTGDTSHA